MPNLSYLHETRTTRDLLREIRQKADEGGETVTALALRLGLPAARLRAVTARSYPEPIGRLRARRVAQRSGLPYIGIRNLDVPLGELIQEEIDTEANPGS